MAGCGSGVGGGAGEGHGVQGPLQGPPRQEAHLQQNCRHPQGKRFFFNTEPPHTSFQKVED